MHSVSTQVSLSSSILVVLFHIYDGIDATTTAAADHADDNVSN